MEANFRTEIEKVEEFFLSLPQLENKPVHRFAEGLYCRELTMPKDTVWISKVHKHENFAFIMTGSCTVISENGSELVIAPMMTKTLVGTKRILRIHEDSTWVTVHALPPELGQDIEQIEEYYACGTLAEFEQLLLEQQDKAGVIS